MTQRLHAHVGTIRQLELVWALYRHGSVKGAADALFLTQPTVSMQLKKLSESVGFPLYQQIGRKLVFTEAGLALAEAAKDVLQRFSDLESQLADMKGLKAGTLRLAVVTTAKYFIPHLLGPFCQRYPAIDVQLYVGNREKIIERLTSAEDDFCVFSHLPTEVDLHASEFLANPLVAFTHSDHPLARKSRCTLADLMAETFIEREGGSGTRHAIEAFFGQHRVQPRRRMTIASNEAIRHAVMAGLGVSILSEYTLALGSREGLHQLDIAGLPIQTHWYFARLRKQKNSLLAQTFIDYVDAEGRARLISQLAGDTIIQDIAP